MKEGKIVRFKTFILEVSCGIQWIISNRLGCSELWFRIALFTACLAFLIVGSLGFFRETGTLEAKEYVLEVPFGTRTEEDIVNEEVTKMFE